MFLSSNAFKFQPGHRKRIKKIVDEAKQLVGTCTRAGKGKQSKHGKDDLLRQWFHIDCIKSIVATLNHGR